MNPQFAIQRPIKGLSGASLVGYEWRSTVGEKWNAHEGGFIAARVSDWDRSDQSQGTGREIVHVYYVQHPDGRITPEGIQSAKHLLGLDAANLNKLAKREQAIQRYREEQEQAEAAIWDRAATDSPATALTNFRTVNYSPLRDFDANLAICRSALVFTKGGKFVARTPGATEQMLGFGWQVTEARP